MPANTTDIEKRLWDAADELRANSKLKSSEYSVPVLGLILSEDVLIKRTAMALLGQFGWSTANCFDLTFGAGRSLYALAA